MGVKARIREGIKERSSMEEEKESQVPEEGEAAGSGAQMEELA